MNRDRDIVERVQYLNRHYEGNWFVCFKCSYLILDCGETCPTDKRGENELFCRDCCKKCTTCQRLYARGYQRAHRHVNECWEI